MRHGYWAGQRHYTIPRGEVATVLRLFHELPTQQSEGKLPYLLLAIYTTDIRQSTSLSNQFKPAILQCFGDIAQAIGPHFETYLSVVGQVLQQAANVTMGPDGAYDMLDYVVSLREGIMDAWGGIIIALKQGKSRRPLPETRFH